MEKLATLISFMYLLTYVISQECTDVVTVGSLSHDSETVIVGYTFILAGYAVPCSGTVVAWEFCYQRSGATSVTFYPGIWRITEMSGGNLYYELVQSNTVTYEPSVTDTQNPTNDFPCQIFNLSHTHQFTAPAGSVVGLYSNFGTQLLHTDTNSSITTHQFDGNQSNITIAGSSSDVNYNIAIRGFIVSTISDITTVSSTALITSTSTAVVATSPVDVSSSIASTYSASTGSSSDATMVTPTTSIDDMPLSNTSSDSSAAIIGGVMGGVILVLVITLILCTVLLCMRRSHRKGTFAVDDKVPCKVTKLNTNVKIDDNPAYDVTAFNTVDNLDLPVTANPSYAAPTKANGDDEHNHVQANEFSHCSDLEGTIKMDTNPSYGITGEAVNTTSDTKPHHSSHNTTTEQHDYDYACDDHFLHHITVASAAGDAKRGYIQAPASFGQNLYIENVHSLSTDDSTKPSNEYDDVSPPKGGDIDYETTHNTSDTLYI